MASHPLGNSEDLLIGSWLQTPSGLAADETCKRIESLVRHDLEHVADHPQHGAWESLFRDPRDGRFWERFYPQGEMHGGGPPALRRLSGSEAKAKYPATSSQ